MTEFRHYLIVIQRRLPLFLLVSVVVAAGTYAIVGRQTPTYKLYTSFVVSLVEREQTDEYTFDGYYALQATEHFTATLAGWTQAPESIVAAYRDAELPLPSNDARQLVRHITAIKKAPQLLEVVVAGESRETAEKLATALSKVVTRNVEKYNDQGVPKLHFRVITTQPWISMSKPTAGLIAGAVFGITLVLLINSLLLWESTLHAGGD